jgi:hypothetical protein
MTDSLAATYADAHAVEASALADELAAHMRRLMLWDANPRTNATQIDATRQLAKECADALSAYLISTTLVGI